MKLLRKRDISEERYTNAFLGYGPEDAHFVIELTYSKLRNTISNYKPWSSVDDFSQYFSLIELIR